MRMYDLITKKKHGGTLTAEELRWMVEGYVAGEIPDYQMSAMLMAIWFSGMTAQETTELTIAMADSGDRVDLSAIAGKKVDKHSTGGVGDKTTLICAPIVAACGGRVAKMSGRGLGHTGGTVDKLEAIPGYETAISREKFFSIVNECGVSVIGQSGNLAPADKKLYALRDVTATVDSIPLIASSIMSKKLAAGSDCILLDVKTGSGAFMKTLDDAIALAQTMVAIGEGAGRRTVALITDMDTPLGLGIGNSIEVAESMDVLRGKGPHDLTEVSLQLAENMLYLVGKGTIVAELRRRHPGLFVSVSATTRAPRPGEIDGVHYLFVDEAAFDRMVERGQMLEWALVHGRHRYGTPRGPVQAELDAGRPALVEIDLDGARQVRRSMPGARLIFVAPPSWDELVARLAGRGTEDEGERARRLATARVELGAAGEFDHVIVNDTVSRATDELEGLMGLSG